MTDKQLTELVNLIKSGDIDALESFSDDILDERRVLNSHLQNKVYKSIDLNKLPNPLNVIDAFFKAYDILKDRNEIDKIDLSVLFNTLIFMRHAIRHNNFTHYNRVSYEYGKPRDIIHNICLDIYKDGI